MLGNQSLETRRPSTQTHSSLVIFLAPALLAVALSACARPTPNPAPPAPPAPPPFSFNCSLTDPFESRKFAVSDEAYLREALQQAEIDRSRPTPVLDPKLEQALALFVRGGYFEALPVIRKFADKGSAEALTALGKAQESGLGLPKDLGMAQVGYLAAMAHGSAEAAGRLGIMGLSGAAPTMGQGEALDLVRRAADQGEGDFQFLLAEMYERGQPVPRNSDRAFCQLLNSGSHRDPWAMFYLGLVHDFSLGDPDQALVWYWRAAQSGHSRAASIIANMYEEGRGLPQDEAQALTWYEVAVNNRPQATAVAPAWYDELVMGRDSRAATALAKMYREGRGAPRDLMRAAFWAALALDQDKESAALAQEIAAELPPGEWERIRAEARAWRPKPWPLRGERLFPRLGIVEPSESKFWRKTWPGN